MTTDLLLQVEAHERKWRQVVFGVYPVEKGAQKGQQRTWLNGGCVTEESDLEAAAGFGDGGGEGSTWQGVFSVPQRIPTLVPRRAPGAWADPTGQRGVTWDWSSVPRFTGVLEAHCPFLMKVTKDYRSTSHFHAILYFPHTPKPVGSKSGCE